MRPPQYVPLPEPLVIGESVSGEPIEALPREVWRRILETEGGGAIAIIRAVNSYFEQYDRKETA